MHPKMYKASLIGYCLLKQLCCISLNFDSIFPSQLVRRQYGVKTRTLARTSEGRENGGKNFYACVLTTCCRLHIFDFINFVEYNGD